MKTICNLAVLNSNLKKKTNMEARPDIQNIIISLILNESLLLVVDQCHLKYISDQQLHILKLKLQNEMKVHSTTSSSEFWQVSTNSGKLNCINNQRWQGLQRKKSVHLTFVMLM